MKKSGLQRKAFKINCRKYFGKNRFLKEIMDIKGRQWNVLFQRFFRGNRKPKINEKDKKTKKQKQQNPEGTVSARVSPESFVFFCSFLFFCLFSFFFPIFFSFLGFIFNCTKSFLAELWADKRMQKVDLGGWAYIYIYNIYKYWIHKLYFFFFFEDLWVPATSGHWVLGVTDAPRLVVQSLWKTNQNHHAFLQTGFALGPRERSAVQSFWCVNPLGSVKGAVLPSAQKLHENSFHFHRPSTMLHSQFSMSGLWGLHTLFQGRVGVNVQPLVVDRATVHGWNLGDNSVVSFSIKWPYCTIRLWSYEVLFGVWAPGRSIAGDGSCVLPGQASRAGSLAREWTMDYGGRMTQTPCNAPWQVKEPRWSLFEIRSEVRSWRRRLHVVATPRLARAPWVERRVGLWLSSIWGHRECSTSSCSLLRA